MGLFFIGAPLHTVLLVTVPLLAALRFPFVHVVSVGAGGRSDIYTTCPSSPRPRPPSLDAATAPPPPSAPTSSSKGEGPPAIEATLPGGAEIEGP